MKKTILFVATVLVMTGCGSVSTTSVSNALNTAAQATAAAATVAASVEGATVVNTLPAKEAGASAGKTLQAVYKQYVADGKKLDYKNAAYYTNLLQLLSDCSALPGNVKNKEYMKDFGLGMIATSDGLVVLENVESVTNSLKGISESYVTATQAESTTSGKLAAAATATSALSTLLSSFGK